MQLIPVDRDTEAATRVSGRLALAGVDSLRESVLRCSLALYISVLIAAWYSKNYVRIYVH